MSTLVRLLFISGLIFQCYITLGDSLLSPWAYVAVSGNGRYLFAMIPHNESGYGVAYELTSKGEFKELWKTEDWYAYGVYISSDGKYLVRIGNWPSGREPSENDLAIAFYENGKLLKLYSTKAMIKNINMIEPSASHYRFMQGDPGFIKPFFGHDFKLTTIDNIEYIFDVCTGAIIQSRQIRKP